MPNLDQKSVVHFDSIDEYLAALSRLQLLPPMTPEQIELAKLYAYALFKRRPWLMRSFEMLYSSLDGVGSALDKNLVAHVDTYAQLADAPDMQEFANWVASGQVDYFQSLSVGQATR